MKHKAGLLFAFKRSHRHHVFKALLLNMIMGLGLMALMSAPVAAGVEREDSDAQETEITQTQGIQTEGTQTQRTQTQAIHLQASFVEQGNAAFHSDGRGPNSLDPAARGRETLDVTLYAGFRPWTGAEVWINPEIDQGFGLSNTTGVAGFPSGEAYKVGHSDPYIMIHRLFFRQTLDLDGAVTKIDADQNQLEGRTLANRLVLTLGKISVGDIFDTNIYAHDPREDFFNWSIIDAGSFDYAADAWGYSYGAAGEWYEGPWTLRTGLYALSRLPNGKSLDARFEQFQSLAEVERRFDINSQPGSLKLTGFFSRAHMGAFSDALRLSPTAPPDVNAVRRYQGHGGLSLNLQQQITGDLGAFARAGFSDGHQQAYEFTDINRTLSAGLALKGTAWSRPEDVWGFGFAINQISHLFKTYLEAGGSGILIGDGGLSHSGSENILETYYSWRLIKAFKASLDYQLIANPAYNHDRGPVSILGLRLHAEM